MSDNVIADNLVLAINVVLLAAMLVSFVSVMSITTQLNSRIDEQNIQALRLEEYKKYNQYDNTHVYAQDVITAIFQYRGQPAVKVSTPAGPMIWARNNAASEYTTTAIMNLINMDTIYDSNIDYGNNGEVVSVVFSPCSGGCGR